MTLRKFLLASTALSAAALLASPAFAGSAAASQGEIDALKAQVEALTQRLDDIAIQSGNDIKEIKDKQDAVQIDFKDGKPTFRTGDGLFTMSIRGRAHLDSAFYNLDAQDTARMSTANNPLGGGSNTGLSSGSNFRRAEFGVEGTFLRDWGYKLNMQWGNSGDEGPARIKDLYLTYSGIKPITIWAGAIQTPMTLDDSTSSNDITFMERAAAANLATSLGAGDGRTSFGVTAATAHLYGSAFYTTNTVNQGFAAGTNTSNEGSAYVGRVAYAFQPDEHSNIHIGASGTYKADPNGGITFSDRPELRVDPSTLINTGSLTGSLAGVGAESAYAVGPELAGNYGPFRAQAEYYFYGVDRNGTATDPDFSAWYVQASWVITGEEYKYAMDPAAYKGVKPASPFTFGGGIGAWELAARYSVADLNYNEGSVGSAVPTGGVRGGKQDVITAGINWYPNNNVRFMFEYQDVSTDKIGLGNADVGVDYSVIASRMQFAF